MDLILLSSLFYKLPSQQPVLFVNYLFLIYFYYTRKRTCCIIAINNSLSSKPRVCLIHLKTTASSGLAVDQFVCNMTPGKLKWQCPGILNLMARPARTLDRADGHCVWQLLKSLCATHCTMFVQ